MAREKTQKITIFTLLCGIYDPDKSVFQYSIKKPKNGEFVKNYLPEEFKNGLEKVWSQSATVSRIFNRTGNQPGTETVIKMVENFNKDSNIIWSMYDIWNEQWLSGANFEYLEEVLFQQTQSGEKEFVDHTFLTDDINEVMVNSTDGAQLLTMATIFALLGTYMKSVQFDWKLLHKQDNTANDREENQEDNNSYVHNTKQDNNNSNNLNLGNLNFENKNTDNYRSFAGVLKEHEWLYGGYARVKKESDHVLKIYPQRYKSEILFLRDHKFLHNLQEAINPEYMSEILSVTYHEKEMEYWVEESLVEGKQLYDKIGKHVPFSEYVLVSEMMEWMLQLITAIKHLHGHGIIHGDINYHNILIDTQNANRAYLIDYSDSVYNGYVNKSSKTITWIDMKAPEQCQEGAPLDYSTDIFGLGNILRYLLANLKDEELLGEEKLLKLHIVHQKAMLKTRENRYQSIIEFEKDFLKCFE